MGTFTKPLVVHDEDGAGPFAEPVKLVNPDGTKYAGGGATGTTAWDDITGKPAAAAAISDPADNADAAALAANQKKILAALRAWGIVSPK